MPFRIVQQDQRVYLPPWVFAIELPYKMPEESGHDVGVSVSLGQRKPYAAFSIKSQYERDPRGDLLIGEGCWRISRHPEPPEEAGRVQPRLVHIDDAPTNTEFRQHRKRILLPEDKASLAVRLEWHLPCETVAHLEILPHDSTHEQVIYFQCSHLLDGILDLARPEDRRVKRDQ